MPPRSPGRKPKYTKAFIQEEWERYIKTYPLGTLTAFARKVGLSLSWTRAIVNCEPWALYKPRPHRDNVHDLSSDKSKDDSELDSNADGEPTGGLMFFGF